MSKKKQDAECCSRLGKVGGQAVLEGVMMKSGDKTVTTCRKPDGSLVVVDAGFTSVRKKVKFLGLPIIRGIVNFIEMMILSVRTLNDSAEALGIEEEESKFEKWMKKHLGIGLTDVIMVVAVILGVVLALGLFLWLPSFLSGLMSPLFSGLEDGARSLVTALVEGVLKIAIFLTYLWLICFMPDIRRTFMYHGAEHKSIACFESGAELTPENAMKCRRFHPRCGTSFMFFMILLGVIAGFFIRFLIPGLLSWQYVLIRLGILPLLVGVGYEYIMFAGKHDNVLTRILSAPGLWVQRLTTKEPTLDMLEVAITSLKCAMRDEIPEFGEFYAARPWEAKPEEAPAEETTPAEEVAPLEETAPAEEVSPVEATAPAEETAPVAETESENPGDPA